MLAHVSLVISKCVWVQFMGHFFTICASCSAPEFFSPFLGRNSAVMYYGPPAYWDLQQWVFWKGVWSLTVWRGFNGVAYVHDTHPYYQCICPKVGHYSKIKENQLYNILMKHIMVITTVLSRSEKKCPCTL